MPEVRPEILLPDLLVGLMDASMPYQRVAVHQGEDFFAIHPRDTHSAGPLFAIPPWTNIE